MTADLMYNCAHSKRLMRRLKGKSGRAGVRAVNNLADSWPALNVRNGAHLEAGN
ncbi:MAG TPA: hypothetical protein VHY37_11830 [Tepidisphaeraceae bacterium]|nr:hypothetical protein [Tepidisphaeraceae bacterium]